MTSRPPPPPRSAPPTGTPIRPRDKKASVACAECRKRKAKASLTTSPILCNGGVPCERCRQHKITCILDEEADGRRKGALERRIDALENDRGLLQRLVGSIHQDNPRDLHRILDFIRTNASLDEVRHFLADSPQEADWDQIQLFDHPLYQVPAQPWTDLTHDSDYVSRLISLYFTWIHPVQGWIDRDLFIRDMQSGNPDATFCSPLLVNALLAIACCYLNLPDPILVQGAPPGRLRFFSEAKRLLDEEEGKLSLTSFQGRCAVYLSTCVLCKHMLGWQYLVDIGECARELMVKRNTLIMRAAERAEELSQALETALIGSFSLRPVAIPNLHQPSMMQKPARNSPPQAYQSGDDWCSYPIKGAVVASHANIVSDAFFNLQLILWDISDTAFGSNQEYVNSPREVADVHCHRLEQWASRIPECMTFRATPTPAALDLQMRYESAMISVSGGISVSQNTNKPGLIPSGADQVRLSSARSIGSLLGEFASRWPVMYMPLNYVQYASMALSVLLYDLDNTESKQLFASTFAVVHTLARRLPMAQEVLQQIREKAGQAQIPLPEEVLSPGAKSSPGP
ncbi:hypothetical protein BO71DRAFT_433961 [Aspergillus ellipticus CBS 707.79]|uniref:Zn(2)-C6 fungal-type domain-containing protein n=1 Tax=Aspergillus ellipticus CBS 707.79 TaxID=1448320 RepID=A0A319EHA6_9EURO|nr:hypothetical protein BO71DRAFT_433961 [Aspergillus ellipticus CBS 707.79]